MKFAYSFNEENYHGSENSIERALAEAAACADECESVFIAEVVPFNPWIESNSIIEMLTEDACEHAGEVAEDWLSHITDEQRGELGIHMNNLIKRWLKRHKNEASFFGVDNVKQYELKTGKVI